MSSTAYGAANNLNQILTAGAATLSYADGRGNLTGDGTWTYTYNTESMLTGATKAGVTVSFDYDGANRQIRKTVGSTKTRFVYSGDQLLAEYNDATSALLKRYVYALGKDDPIMVIDASNNVTYLHADHLGSIIAQTNPSGVIVNKYQYSPHGQSVSLTGTTFGFTGQRFDSDLGLYHYKARYYSPALCRFLQADPAGYEVGYNLYPYAKNDPINLLDSDGMKPEPFQVKSAYADARLGLNQMGKSIGLGAAALAIAGLGAASGALESVLIGALLRAVSASTIARIPIAAGTAATGSLAQPRYRGGEFSVAKWYQDKFPQFPGLKVPSQPLTLLDKTAHKLAEVDKIAANKNLRRVGNLKGSGLDVHEQVPIKFGGNAVDWGNKILINERVHEKRVTPWWNELQGWLEGRRN